MEKYNLKQSDLGNAGQVRQIEKGEIWKNLYLLFFVSFMPYAPLIIRSGINNFLYCAVASSNSFWSILGLSITLCKNQFATVETTTIIISL